jgi:thiamine biosynthesis lipoprotein
MGYAACWRPMPLQSRESDLEVRRARPLLGTVVEIRAATRTMETARVHAAIDRAFDRIELVHHLMSHQDPNSELSSLNRCEPSRAQPVSPHTYEVLKAAVHFARLSGGAFDPCVGSSWEDIELLRGNRVRFKRPVRLDLGGIAKGYAVDLAMETMQRAHMEEIMVNAGGDLRIAGAREVHLRHPQAPTAAVTPLWLRDCALASSASYFSPALLNPRTQQPYVGKDSVSVRARDCMTADALTKIVLFAPGCIAERALEECGAEALVLRPAQGAIC